MTMVRFGLVLGPEVARETPVQVLQAGRHAP
jgi:hypothetical protein